ncbi:MAG: response regulator, partial [Desulfuromonadales bacterium]|nr:response regulator [Desulfuromonadales bacterium]
MARILVADDSNTDLAFIREILKDTRHEILIATDGESAEHQARTAAPDLIVLDVIMPGKNGFQVCRDLKRDDRFKHIPIILV